MMNVCETLARASTSEFTVVCSVPALVRLSDRDLQMNKVNLESQFGAGEG